MTDISDTAGRVLLATRGPLVAFPFGVAFISTVGRLAERHGYTDLQVDSAGNIWGNPPTPRHAGGDQP